MYIGNVINFLDCKPPTAKISVEYRKDSSYIRGFILDNEVHKSVTGNAFIFVNNMATRILVSDIKSMSWSGAHWVNLS